MPEQLEMFPETPERATVPAGQGPGGHPHLEALPGAGPGPSAADGPVMGSGDGLVLSKSQRAAYIAELAAAFPEGGDPDPPF